MRRKTLLPVLLVAACLPAARAEYVYRNSTVDLNTRFNPGLIEVGDEIILGGTLRNLTHFDFQYYGISFSGNEQARVRFYLNDGTAFGGDTNYLRPSTVFYDSGLFNISATARSTLNFDLSLDGIVLPERFTWSVQFTGISGGESAGVDLYGPPSVGSSFNDYWYNDTGTGWEPRTNGVPINFAAQFQAVPEPSTWALGVVGGLCGFFLLRRRSDKA